MTNASRSSSVVKKIVGTYFREVQEPLQEIRWFGSPATGIKVEKRATLYLVISITWIGLSVWLFTAGHRSLPVLFPIVWVIWIGKELWADARDRKGLAYAISDDMAIFYLADPNEARVMRLEYLVDTRLEIHRDGTGSIFTRVSEPGYPRDKNGIPVEMLLFAYIDAPQRVYSMLLEAKENRRAMPNRAYQSEDVASRNGRYRGP